MIDIHYTPHDLAQAMIACVPAGFTPTMVADFSAGEGSLLNEASRHWPEATIFANDLNKKSTRMLASLNKSWVVSCSDFLKPTSHTSTKFSSKQKSMDLILLNPPFSERGRKAAEWFDKPSVKSGLAATFVNLSLKYLSAEGYMIAILPNGSLHSERDSQAWTEISKDYVVEIIADNPMRTFKTAVARTSIVRITRRRLTNTINKDPISHANNKSCALHRGRMQMHSIKNCLNGFPLVHTTELRNGIVILNNKHGLVSAKAFVKGPALLFPRVGMITPEKICVLESRHNIVLSDCVLALEFAKLEHALAVRNHLLSDWGNFSIIYSGTGAKYTTIKRVAAYFSEINHTVTSERINTPLDLAFLGPEPTGTY